METGGLLGAIAIQRQCDLQIASKLAFFLDRLGTESEIISGHGNHHLLKRPQTLRSFRELQAVSPSLLLRPLTVSTVVADVDWTT